ncbi:hypothetical protein FHX82_000222 [Amycolatopsis bartoniae]|uniref:Uncharacterized protein n=1 Tax=Amycolatopsis bartoniae TaxID=941986 RepID=A0A8H9ME26_9PSEU|nr:hypothetical protein [Amycolatopsis bartoniae]MBB2933202.1 hypothetical protein [Amycolatopsis bartoniae]TVT11808.1 hypothetical protein FNH07_00325 [Amycolatopsis bartoniae]GHF57815.1 hypothetical protein GCM10017566_33830 [Amycolatopsis bartoniae]
MTEQLEARVAKLEDEVPEAIAIARDARHHAAMAEALARGASLEAGDCVSILRGHTNLLNAIRDDHVEQGQRLDRVEQRMDRIEKEMKEGFSMVAVGMSQITALIKGVES